ncbi:GNAT family N-acetyltransferase [Nocardioides sp. MAH-18]|uniref:GNAT family N-acetyltransferase n=1 Tax=Nocardioides agri TaxID=2682843 RepID=A0A6L6XNM7_9ACTN|nr:MULTISPECIES: GNAT family N-acetyltransferase [unclassified Nocardioides]MBA2953991.1 GNAT family N-acetyltransferase [Nocardioides sp. CGMCC 1.13656]MVQ48854.1 GNAT family N-acetyltransferase [Nocardioides sp. MAH-18]
MLHVTGPGRAEVRSTPAGSPVDPEALGAALDAAFADGVGVVGWWVPVGDWVARRTAWRLGFAYGGVLRGWVDGADAWAFTLGADDPREPRTRWLDCPVIEGDGVRLRPLTTADAPRVVEGIGDPDTQFWLSFMPRDPGPAEGLAYLETALVRLADNHTVTWGFAETGDDRLLGAVGLYRLDTEPELGYWTHPDARGRGLTVRAARLALGHAFGTLGLSHVAAYAAAGNAASLGVLEALGMRRVGVRRRSATTGDGRVADLVGYDLLAEELSAG